MKRKFTNGEDLANGTPNTPRKRARVQDLETFGKFELIGVLPTADSSVRR